MTIQEMKQKKQELGYSNAQLAQLAGVPLGTVQKIFSGATRCPRYDTLNALERVLSSGSGSHQVSENTFYQAKAPGTYTLEDYYRLPDEQRMELIDGVFYDMSAPTPAHQLISGYLFAQLFQHVRSNGGACLPLISPLDVQLDCDDKTMVQPDVVIVCDRNKVINRCIYGAPDFIIEVLSVSTRKKDMVIKLNKYMNAGVREYWIVDPDKQKVLVYDFEHDNYPIIYGFDSRVPINIWNGTLEIDFKDLYEEIRFLYERG